MERKPTVKHLTDTCTEVRFDRSGGGFKQDFLLISDVHYDNPKCDRRLLHSHLDQARERNAYVLSFGDLFCAMQGRYDGRSNKSDIRPEHNTGHYLDSLVNDTAEKLSPWADRFLLFADGNHETGIYQRMETDLTARLIDRLNAKYKGNVQRGAYMGFVRFVLTHGGSNARKYTLFYHHGLWGGVVTKGTMSAQRFASIVPGADAVVTGHTHDRWIMQHDQVKLKQNGELRINPQIHLKCGGYKEEFATGKGWAVQKIGMPKSLGGIWMRLEVKKKGGSPEVVASFTMA